MLAYMFGKIQQGSIEQGIDRIDILHFFLPGAPHSDDSAALREGP